MIHSRVMVFKNFVISDDELIIASFLYAIHSIIYTYIFIVALNYYAVR